MVNDDLDYDGVEKKGGSGKMILILVITLVVVLLGTAIALRFLTPGLIPGWGEKKAASSTSNGVDLGAIIELKPFIVNLADPGGNRYLRVVISLELENADVEKEIDARRPQIRDTILTILSSQTRDDISYTEGHQRLKSIIAASINQFLTTGAVKSVFFSEFVIQ